MDLVTFLFILGVYYILYILFIFILCQGQLYSITYDVDLLENLFWLPCVYVGI